jgi:hypothetical protein
MKGLSPWSQLVSPVSSVNTVTRYGLDDWGPIYFFDDSRKPTLRSY